MKKFGLLRFGLKAGIITSAVYLTIENGVWRDNETTSELYMDLRKKLKPYIKPLAEQVPFQLPELPKTGDVVSSAKTAWNKGVVASCLFLIDLPELTWQYAKKGTMYTYKKISEEYQAFSNVKSDKENDSKNLAN